MARGRRRHFDTVSAAAAKGTTLRASPLIMTRAVLPRRSALHGAPRPDSVRSKADAVRSASSTAAARYQTAALRRATGPAARRGSRMQCPTDGNRPRQLSGLRNATRWSQADRRHRSSRSAGRSTAPIAAQSAPASGRDACDPPPWPWGRARQPPGRRRGSFRSSRTARTGCRWRPSPEGPPRRRQVALPLIGIRRTLVFAASVFGRITVSTPLRKVAFAFSRSMPCGRPIRRSKRP